MNRANRPRQPRISGSSYASRALSRAGDGSTLSLDFTTGVLDPRLTLSRAGGGTYVGPDGYIYGIDSATSSSLAIGTGSKSVTLTATAGVNRRFEVGQTVYFSNGANNMSGLVTAYSPSTQVITINATSSSGSGSFTSWFVGNASARFDYDPTTLTTRGLLIEASAVNYVLQSAVNTFPSPWSTAGTNLPTTTVAYTGGGFAPDNITSPTRIQFGLNAGGSASRLLQATAYTTNPTTAAPYTVSVWMKSNTPGTSYSINIYKTTGNNLVTVTDSWQRFTVVNTSGTSLVGYIYISNESASVAADILIWGVQLEAGNGASSYIPTGASTGSRVEDSATMSSVDSLGFDLYQGTFLVRGTQFKQSVSGTYARTMRLAGATEPFGLAVDGLTLFGTSRNAANASIAEATRTNVLLENFAFGFALNANNATNTMVVSRNGSSTSANRSATGPTGTVTALSFNSNSAATAYASMALRSVKFWPVAKTAAELNALTTGA